MSNGGEKKAAPALKEEWDASHKMAALPGADLAIMSKVPGYEKLVKFVVDNPYLQVAADLCEDAKKAHDKGVGYTQDQAWVYFNYAKFQSAEKVRELAEVLRESADDEKRRKSVLSLASKQKNYIN